VKFIGIFNLKQNNNNNNYNYKRKTLIIKSVIICGACLHTDMTIIITVMENINILQI